MKNIRNIFVAFVAMFALASAPLVVSTNSAVALDPAESIQEGVKGAGGGSGGDEELKSGLKTVINVLLFLLGAIAVVVIVIGGIKYTLSNGDSTQITSAKNTILYSVVGLVVALLAYAIVNFVIDAFV